MSGEASGRPTGLLAWAAAQQTELMFRTNVLLCISDIGRALAKIQRDHSIDLDNELGALSSHLRDAMRAAGVAEDRVRTEAEDGRS